MSHITRMLIIKSISKKYKTYMYYHKLVIEYRKYHTGGKYHSGTRGKWNRRNLIKQRGRGKLGRNKCGKYTIKKIIKDNSTINKVKGLCDIRGTQYHIQNFISYKNMSSPHQIFFTSISKEIEPNNYLEAINNSVWLKVMRE